MKKLDSYRILENQQNSKQQNEKWSDFKLRIFSTLLRETRGSIIKDNSRPIKWDTLCTRHRWYIFVFHIWWSTNKIFNLGLKNLLMLPDKRLEILIESVFVLVSASKYILARRDSKYCDCWSLTWKKIVTGIGHQQEALQIGTIHSSGCKFGHTTRGIYFAKLLCPFCVNILALWNDILQTKIIILNN